MMAKSRAFAAHVLEGTLGLGYACSPQILSDDEPLVCQTRGRYVLCSFLRSPQTKVDAKSLRHVDPGLSLTVKRTAFDILHPCVGVSVVFLTSD